MRHALHGFHTPRPRVWDWAVAGLAAGLLLGTAEAALARLWEVDAPPALILAQIGATAALVAVPIWLLWLLLLPLRPGYSRMIGIAVGPLLAAPALGALAPDVIRGELRGPDAALPVLGLVVAGAVGLLVGRGADARERRINAPAPALVLWGGVAVFIAFAERLLASGAGAREWAGVACLGGAMVIGLMGFLSSIDVEWGRARGAVSVFGTLLLAAVSAVGVAWLPTLWPWLARDAQMVSEAPAAPSLLVVGLPLQSGTPAPRLASAELVATEGIVFERVASDAQPAQRAIFTLPDGSSLISWLEQSGRATAAVLADARREAPPGVGELRTRPAADALLRREQAHASGGRLLTLVEGPMLARLALDSQVRGATDVTGDAIRWLLSWSDDRRPPPFALYVEYAGDGPPEPVGILDAELTRLFGLLGDLGLAPSTIIVIAEPRPASDESGATALRAILRAPHSGASEERRGTVTDPIDARRLAEDIRRLSAGVAIESWPEGTG